MRVVQLLLNRGALLHRDHNGRNPLHLAAMSGYTQTIELLYSVHSHLLDQVDKDGVCVDDATTITSSERIFELWIEIIKIWDQKCFFLDLKARGRSILD